MIPILVFIVAWFIGGAPSIEPGDPWFVLGVVCCWASFCFAIASSKIGQTSVFVAANDGIEEEPA